MLPDFLSMSRARLDNVSDPTIAEGIAFHHRTDDAFHQAGAFVELQAEGITALEASGVGRGTARAVAHVGLELLLDGFLMENEPACVGYLEAVKLEGDLGLSFRRGGERFETLRARVPRYGLPTVYQTPEGVAEQLRKILAHRPRLAFSATDAPKVIAWLSEVRPAWLARAGMLLEEVAAGVGVDTASRARAILPHPFPVTSLGI